MASLPSPPTVHPGCTCGHPEAPSGACGCTPLACGGGHSWGHGVRPDQKEQQCRNRKQHRSWARSQSTEMPPPVCASGSSLVAVVLGVLEVSIAIVLIPLHGPMQSQTPAHNPHRARNTCPATPIPNRNKASHLDACRARESSCTALGPGGRPSAAHQTPPGIV